MRSNIVPKNDLPLLNGEGNISLEEDMPYPYVHYPQRFGSFFAFQKTKKSDLFHCSCQKKGMEVYFLHELKFEKISKASVKLLVDGLVDKLQFKDNLCHICNKVCPKYGYTKYGKGTGDTRFHSIYGHYINGLMYEYGIEPYGKVYEPNLIPSDIVPYLMTRSINENRLDEESLKDYKRYCEDVIRIRMGYFAIGKKWATEIKLLEIVKKLYPAYTIIHQYELDHLRADIYIEELNLVIEYQGQQHFKPIDFMGGVEALKKTKERDQEKAELCDYYEIGLVYFSYQDEITEKLVKDRISTYLKEIAN